MKSLTARQEEILHFLSQGKSYQAIALLMNITQGTVKQHIHSIYNRLECNNRTEALNEWRKRSG